MLEDKAPFFSAIKLALGSILVLCSCLGCLFFPKMLYLEAQRTPDSPEDLLNPLSTSQRLCIEQITDKSNLIHVELQDDRNFIGIGYVFSKTVYAAMLDLKENNCEIIFKDEITSLGGHRKNGQPYFHKIQRVELTGDAEPEIYVWLDVYEVPKSGSVHHIFYSKQANGLYEQVLHGGLMCRSWSSVDFVNWEGRDRLKIVRVDDVRCDWWAPGVAGTSYSEILLNNTGYEIINQWHEDEVNSGFMWWNQGK